jgi:hypothetical protein
MKMIEGYLDSRPILKGLSGEPLPLTDRPLPIHGTMSTISGQINGNRRTMMNSTSWLCTDEIQFLFALLLCNQHDNSGVFHVLGPMITHKVALVCGLMPAINSENATFEQQRTYQCNMQGIQAYIDSRLDIFQHKFLVFVCNINDMHWVSVVVVNPLLVFDQYMSEGKENNSDNFVGWCVLNSTQRVAEMEEHGFQGSFFTKNKATYGVLLFLNICASYLKAKRRNKGDIRQAMELDYEEPFGKWQETKGTEEFPWFDFQCPSIIQQSTSHDCGLAVVANSMAFVKKLKGNSS